jgi:hypothetical protein
VQAFTCQCSGSAAKRRHPVSFLSQHSCLIAFFDCENAGAFPSVLFAPLCKNGLKLRVWFEYPILLKNHKEKVFFKFGFGKLSAK